MTTCTDNRPAGIDCPKCGGTTLAPIGKEEGDYCEACGIAWDVERVKRSASR